LFFAAKPGKMRGKVRDEEEGLDMDEEQEEEEEEEPVAKSARKGRRSVTTTTTTSSKKKKSRLSDEVEETDDNVAPTNKPNEQAKTVVYSSSMPLKLDQREKKKVAAVSEALKYYSNGKSNSAASLISEEELKSVASSVTRFVLFTQLNGKPVTGKDIVDVITATVVSNSDKKDFSKNLLGFLRVEIARRLQVVFGFDLFAGGVDDELKVTDKWFITNGLESDELKRMCAFNTRDEESQSQEEKDGDEEDVEKREGADAELDRLRGFLMVVLSVIMISKDEISEANLFQELSSFGMMKETTAQTKKRLGPNKPDIQELLTRLAKLGFILKKKTEFKDSNHKPIHVYRWGDKALNEIGKRAVLQFMIQTCDAKVDEHDEAEILRLNN